MSRPPIGRYRSLIAHGTSSPALLTHVEYPSGRGSASTVISGELDAHLVGTTPIRAAAGERELDAPHHVCGDCQSRADHGRTVTQVGSEVPGDEHDEPCYRQRLADRQEQQPTDDAGHLPPPLVLNFTVGWPTRAFILRLSFVVSRRAGV